ncbi:MULTISPECIES: DUF3240 family protein [Bradyrhizobium]|uniref:DUF3240 family protein n=1 Tax=Bradyrhizobium aeschynomenes TaxID=2734909 RepID=A0ABX2CCV7_9BRAD|nr:MULTISPECIES: DUF3240 family protein [Bradyrhizobium]NPU09463.1 DUF3240 family protein [Bradyrhizobium aeschynomenes]NPU66061.1 DUF3240 family protein [Bradyrhizobium aeschynomenes]NPV20785.1 DUF3240 family protein [Bradyrhizobium aeschynomenes]
MTGQAACLTLIAPCELREELFDYITEQTDLVTGFTASDAAGHGARVRLRSAAERVKGHADEIVVRIVLQEADCERLLERLRSAFGGTKLVYWVMPVTAFGIID